MSVSESMRGSSGSSQRQREFGTRLSFFGIGLSLAAWAAVIPYAKANIGAGDDTLGLLLLCLGLGSLAGMPVAGMLTTRFGCRSVIVAATLLTACALPVLGSTTSFPTLVCFLLLFGASVGSLEVAVNVQAVIVEKAGGRAIMSGFHGLFSVGGIVGALAVTAALASGASPFAALVGIDLVLLAAMAGGAAHHLSAGPQDGSRGFVFPRGLVLLIAALCFTVFLAEGAVLDWSAVLLVSNRSLEPSVAGLGYAAFATTMTLGRLSGDRTIRRFGPQRVAVAGGLCAAAGFGLAVLPFWPVSLAGYAMVGAGCANIVPILYTAVGRQTAMPQNLAVSAITAMGYCGILAGPAAIGFLANATSLSNAFLLVAVLLVGVVLSLPLLKL